MKLIQDKLFPVHGVWVQVWADVKLFIMDIIIGYAIESPYNAVSWL